MVRGIGTVDVPQVQKTRRDIRNDDAMLRLDRRSSTKGDGELVNQSWGTPIATAISLILKC